MMHRLKCYSIGSGEEMPLQIMEDLPDGKEFFWYNSENNEFKIFKAVIVYNLGGLKYECAIGEYRNNYRKISAFEMYAAKRDAIIERNGYLKRTRDNWWAKAEKAKSSLSNVGDIEFQALPKNGRARIGSMAFYYDPEVRGDDVFIVRIEESSGIFINWSDRNKFFNDSRGFVNMDKTYSSEKEVFSARMKYFEDLGDKYNNFLMKSEEELDDEFGRC